MGGYPDVSSAITQLQQDALDRKVPVSDLLRRALVVARKLELREFQEWIERELNGYGDSPDTPGYREVHGQVRGWNPHRGWQPVGFTNPQERDFYSRRKCGQSIAELESLVESRRQDGYHMPFPREVDLSFGGITLQTQVGLFTTRSAIVGIIDAVRTIVLNWALKLEEEGVVGRDLTFSAPEKNAARQTPQAVTNFYGPVMSAQVQQGVEHGVQASIVSSPDPVAVRAFLDSIEREIGGLGLREEARAEAEAEARTIEAQLSSPKPKASIIREGLMSIRTILEGAVGGAAAQLLIELGKLIGR